LSYGDQLLCTNCRSKLKQTLQRLLSINDDR